MREENYEPDGVCSTGVDAAGAAEGAAAGGVAASAGGAESATGACIMRAEAFQSDQRQVRRSRVWCT